MLKTVYCKCGSEVIWVRVMGTNKLLPVDKKTEETLILSEQTDMMGHPVMKLVAYFTPHYNWCPDAEEFRKREEGTGRTGGHVPKRGGEDAHDTGGDPPQQETLFEEAP